MDLFAMFSSLCSALGLSGAAGLNAYIPLLTVAIMQRTHPGGFNLPKPYDIMGEWWVIAILIVLLIVEIIVDKVPGADHINDMIQTAVRPAAGAIIFASQHDTMHVHPGILAVAGFLMSGGIHTGKALARPVINVGTAGIGAPVVSVIEDLVSTVLSIVAILLPILAVILLGIFGWLLWKLFRRFFGKKPRGRDVPITVKAIPVPIQHAPPQLEGSSGPVRDWGGGV